MVSKNEEFISGSLVSRIYRATRLVGECPGYVRCTAVEEARSPDQAESLELED